MVETDSWNIFSELRISYLYELRASNAETRRIQTMNNKNESSS